MATRQSTNPNDGATIGGCRLSGNLSRIRAIIIPKANEVDIADIPERARRGIDFHPAGAMEEVVEIVL